MAKICPNCEKENPSVAKCCMFCNTQLVEAEQFSEEDKLRKQNAELKEQLELLKRNKELEQKIKEDDDEPIKSEKEIPVEIVVQEQSKPETVQVATLPPHFTRTETPRMFAHPFSFKGRIRRLEYGFSLIIYFIWYIVMTAWCESDETSGGFFVLLTFIPMFWFIWAQGAKRCHDRDNSGWYQIIPFYALWMLFADSDKMINDYGFPPK